MPRGHDKMPRDDKVVHRRRGRQCRVVDSSAVGIGATSPKFECSELLSPSPTKYSGGDDIMSPRARAKTCRVVFTFAHKWPPTFAN